MMYVLFVIVALGDDYTVYYERNLTQGDCYQMVQEFEGGNGCKASCQIQSPEI